MASLPYGTSTYSRGWPAFGQDAPLYMSHSDGWRAFDGKGGDFVDCIMGLGAVILGHRDPTVDDAIRRQLANGTAFSLGNRLELEAAARVLAHFPDFHMLHWCVNGSDATTGAVRLARAITGKHTIFLATDGYHGFHDWALEGTSRGFGIERQSHAISGKHWPVILRTSSGDFPSGRDAPQDVAAVIIEPDLHPDWLPDLRKWCSKHGVMLIADEVMTWGRYPGFTATKHYGVRPDLWCLGKALGNGMPCSAIVGPRDFMCRLAPGPWPNAFLSMTWAGHPLSMAAVIATLDVLEATNGPKQLWNRSTALAVGLGKIADTLTDILQIGPPPWNRVSFKNPTHAKPWRDLMNDAGCLIYAAHNLSLAHDHPAINRILGAWAHAAVRLREAIEQRGRQPEPEPSVMRR